MRKLFFIFLLLGILLIGSVSAIDWDNKLSYSDEDKKVLIENLYGLPIIGTELAEIEITSHEDLDERISLNVGWGEGLRIEGNNRQDYSNAIKGTEFRNMKTGELEEVRHSWEIAVGFENVEVDNPKIEVCGEDIYSANNDTTSKNCWLENNGTHIEQVITKWKELEEDKRDLIEGDFVIRLMVFVNAGDHYDVIPTLFGKKISNWAEYGNPVVDAHGETPAGYGTPSSFVGNEIKALVNLMLVNVTKEADSGATTVHIYDELGGSELDTASFVGDVATLDYEMTANTLYWIYTYNGGSSYASLRDTSTGLEIQGTNINWTRGTDDGVSPDVRVYNIVSVTTETEVFLPVINGIFPVEGTTYNVNSLDLKYNATIDGGTLDSCWNSDDYGNTNSSRQDCNTNWSSLPASEGSNTRTIYVNDTLGSVVNTTISFIVNTTPMINFSEATPVDYTNQSFNTAFIGATLTETYFGNITFNLYNSSSDIVNSTLFTDGTRSINFTLPYDDTYNYNITVWTNTNQTNSTATRAITMDTTPAIDFSGSTPVDYTNQSFNTFRINITTTETNFNNITFDLYNSSYDLINSTVFTDGTRAINFTLAYENVYNYNVTAWTTTTQTNSTATRRLTYDITAPTFADVYPVNGSTLITLTDPTNISFNATIFDNFALSVCSYFNGTGNTTVTCGENASISLENGNHNLRWYASDPAGNENSTLTSFLLNYISAVTNYTDPAIEGVSYNFNLTISANSISAVNGTLIYNGTSYSTTNSSNSTQGLLETNILMGSVTADVGKSFYWNYTIDGVEYISSTYNHTVKFITPLVINSSCVGLSASMCWDFADEGNLTAMSANLDYNFKFGVTNGTYKEVYGSLTNVNSSCLCINSTIFNNYTLGYGEIQYSKAGWADRRFYTFSTQRLSNTSINNTLYLLESSSATSFLFDFADAGLRPYVNKYTSLLRWYPDLNEYKIVEMAKTDDKGETIMRVKVEDVDYRVGLYERTGTLIDLLNPVRFACLSSPCSYSSFTVDTDQDYTSYYDVETSLVYNYTSGVWTFIWNDPTQNTENMSLIVGRERGNEVFEICNTQASGFTGVLTCDSSAYTGTIRAVGYRTASPTTPIVSKIINTGTTAFAGDFGLFISFIIFLMLALIGTYSPVASIILGIVGLFPAFLFGTITLAVFIAIGVMGGIIIHFMKRSVGR